MSRPCQPAHCPEFPVNARLLFALRCRNLSYKRMTDYGLIRLQQQSDGSYTVRRERTASQKEKESGASGKEAC